MKKKWNPVGLLSLLSLFSIFGLLTGNKGFFGFLGFLAYLRYFRVIPDEGFWENIKNASMLAFFAQIVLLIPVILVCYLFFEVQNIAGIAFASSFAGGFIVFSVALAYFEWKEQEA